MTTGCMLSTQHSCQRAWLALWGKHRASTIPFTLEKPGACELCPGTAVGRKGTLLPPLCPEAAAASSAGHWEPHTKAPLGADAKQCKCRSLVLRGTSLLLSPALHTPYVTSPASNPCFGGYTVPLASSCPRGAGSDPHTPAWAGRTDRHSSSSHADGMPAISFGESTDQRRFISPPPSIQADNWASASAACCSASAFQQTAGASGATLGSAAVIPALPPQGPPRTILSPRLKNVFVSPSQLQILL